MDKVKKISLILLLWLLTIFFISVVQIRPIPISTNTAIFFQIPVIYWLILMVSPFLLYIIAKDSENPLIPLSCVILYFFLFYSFGLYFLSHPTISDIGSSGQFQSILSSITHIDPKEIDSEIYVSTARYFRWPVFFIFSKIFTSILGIGPIQTLNLGFFSLMLVIPILLPLFYKKTNNVEKISIYFILPALYLVLSWYFINDQFVPQFLGLIYLFSLFGFYIKYMNRKNPLFLLLLIIFYALTVFTHAFIHIFFLVAIIFELYWSEYVEMRKTKFITYGLVIILFAILFPYLDVYYNMATSASGGESWRIFQDLFSQSSSSGVGLQFQFLYHLVPAIYDQFASSITKVMMGAVFSIVVIGFFLYIFKRRKLFNFKRRDLFDISILIGSGSWFLLGLAKLVLGQRALQVAALPLARYFKNPHKLFSHIPKVIVIIILIAPSLFVANDMINSSIQGERLIQDLEENIAGRFMDKHVTNESLILCAQNPYPTGYPSGFRKAKTLEMVDIILNSAKLQKSYMFSNIILPGGSYDSIVYDNKDIEIVILEKEID